MIAFRVYSPSAYFTQCLLNVSPALVSVLRSDWLRRARTKGTERKISAARMSVARMPGGAFPFLLRNTLIYRAALRAAGGQ